MTSADKVFQILGPQYKPLERQLIAALKESGNKKGIAKYRKMSSINKIMVLDRVAMSL